MKYGRKLFLLILLVVYPVCSSQAADPTLSWNTFLGKNSSTHQGYFVKVDSSKNVYIAGYSNTAWDTSIYGNPVNSHSGNTDGVVAKLDSSGNLLWYTFVGSSAGDSAKSLTVDSSGNVYVMGYASGTFASPEHAFVGGIDIFVVKLNSSGSVVWNTFVGSSSSDYGHGISVDSSGNVYIGGESYSGWHSDFNNVKGTNKTSNGYQGVIAKLNSSGVYQWHRFSTIYQFYDLTVSGDYLYTIKKGYFYL